MNILQFSIENDKKSKNIDGLSENREHLRKPLGKSRVYQIETTITLA